MERPELSDYTCYKSLFQAVQLWQVVEMGNTCTICRGSNLHTKCDSCGWWGKVNPNNPKDKPNAK